MTGATFCKKRCSAPIAAALATLALFLAGPATAAAVISVGDGDTLRVDEGGKRVTIRLGCIDAPEAAQAPYGMASRLLLALLAALQDPLPPEHE